jgi:hypothetical protein
MFDRFFGDEPTTDIGVRAGRAVGTIIGVALFGGMAWVALRGTF